MTRPNDASKPKVEAKEFGPREIAAIGQSRSATGSVYTGQSGKQHELTIRGLPTQLQCCLLVLVLIIKQTSQSIREYTSLQHRMS